MTLGLPLAVGLALGAAGCARGDGAPGAPTSAGRSVASTVRASGSSALQPLVNAAKERFEVAHKGTSVEVSAGGSRKGIADVASGAVHLGCSDVAAPADAGLVDHKVAVLAFAPMANAGPHLDGVRALSVEDLARIFSGRARSWRDVGGQDRPIVVINRAAGSGTRTTFGDVVLGGDRFVEAQTEDNSGALVAKLKQTRGSISYLAMSFADPALRVLGIVAEGGVTVAPTLDAVTTGAWPLWSYEHVYTRGAPSGAAKEFLDYLLSPAFQERVLPEVKGFVPITAMKVHRERD